MEKKQIKLKNEIKEMSIEEVYFQFKNFLFKQCQSWRNKYEMDDLQQVAFIGLKKAYDSYDVGKDILFITYASTIITNELRMYHRKNEKHENVLSLNKTFLHKYDEIEYMDTISDDTNYEEMAFKNIECEKLECAINKLSLREKEIVQGIGLKFKGQKEFAERWNLSQSYVSRIYTNALKKIKNIMEDDYMSERKITPEQLKMEVQEHGTSKEALNLIAEKYGLSSSTVRKYLDDFNVRKFSKDYMGKKLRTDKGTNRNMKELKQKTEIKTKKENKEEENLFLQEIKTYRGPIGQYQINGDNVDLQFGNATISIQKENIMNLVLELSELNMLIN